MDNCSNSLTWVGVEILQIMYQIPRSIEMNLLESDLISEPPASCVGFTKAMLKVGVSLPLAPYIRKLLHSFGLAPAQLVPTAWRVIIGMWAVWRKLGFSDPSVIKFQYLFRLCRNPKTYGLWHFKAYEDSNEILLNHVHISIKR